MAPIPPSGRLLTLSNSVSTLTYAYDAANQLPSEHSAFPISNFAFAVSYSYDADGNRASLTGPGGQVVTYSYTSRNQVASVVADGPPPLATFTYDAAGNRITKALENGITSTYNYDDAGRLTSLVHGTGVETLSYTYDTMNRRTSEPSCEGRSAVEPATAGPARVTMSAGSGGHQTRTSGGLRSFGYDATGQLIQVSHSGGNAMFAYDAVGNRTTVSGATGAGSYSANALNQYTSAGGVGSLTYDTNGNLATGGGWTFTHNGDSRLVAVTGTATATFGRDARNREVKRTINGTTTYLIYDGWSLVAEYDATGTLTTRYIHGPRVDEILAKVTTSGSTYPLEDALGSTIAVTDNTGAVLERITYTDAFGTPEFQDASGNPLAGTTAGTRFLFTGREWIADLGLYDYRNRTYSPSLGRFIQVDPIRFEAGDANLYRYVGNRATNARYPLGLRDASNDKNCFKRFTYMRNDVEETGRREYGEWRKMRAFDVASAWFLPGNPDFELWGRPYQLEYQRYVTDEYECRCPNEIVHVRRKHGDPYLGNRKEWEYDLHSPSSSSPSGSA